MITKNIYTGCRKSLFFQKCSLFSNPNPKPLPLGERLCMLGWLCIVQSPCAYTPGIRAGAECGAAALTKQGRLQSVAHSRCTMQRHQRLTTCIGATPQTPFLKLCRFIDSLIYRVSRKKLQKRYEKCIVTVMIHFKSIVNTHYSK